MQSMVKMAIIFAHDDVKKGVTFTRGHLFTLNISSTLLVMILIPTDTF